MSSRADDELISYILTGLRTIGDGFDQYRDGYGWNAWERRMQRRRPRKVIVPAAPPERVQPLIQRLDEFARQQPMGYETLLDTQEVADFLGLKRVSIYNLTVHRHLHATHLGNKLLIEAGELRRYLVEGPSAEMSGREDWHPLVEESPAIRKREEREARKADVRAKYDAMFMDEAADELGLEHDRIWSVVDRMERKGLMERIRGNDYNGYHMVKRSDIPAIKTYLEEERARREQRKAEREASRRRL